MEHYQATGIPEVSASKHTPFTPVGSGGNRIGPSENSLPMELCEICIHGFKVHLFIVISFSLKGTILIMIFI